MPKEMKAMREIPPARPSNPSIILIELITPTVATMDMGMANIPVFI